MQTSVAVQAKRVNWCSSWPTWRGAKYEHPRMDTVPSNSSPRSCNSLSFLLTVQLMRLLVRYIVQLYTLSNTSLLSLCIIHAWASMCTLFTQKMTGCFVPGWTFTKITERRFDNHIATHCWDITTHRDREASDNGMNGIAKCYHTSRRSLVNRWWNSFCTHRNMQIRAAGGCSGGWSRL